MIKRRTHGQMKPPIKQANKQKNMFNVLSLKFDIFIQQKNHTL